MSVGWAKLYVTEELDDAATAVLAETGVTKAHLIREALVMYLKEKHGRVVQSPHPQLGGYRGRDE